MSSKKVIFFLCMCKMYLISAEGYTNAGVHFLRVRKIGKIWASMNNVLGVKRWFRCQKHVWSNFKRNMWRA